MAAPKGNKYGVGHGKPRIHDRDKIFEELIEWAKKPDSININKFCALHDPTLSTKSLILWTKDNESFRESYEQAKSFMAFRREEWLNSEKLHVKAYDLNAAAYDYIIKDDRREQAEYEAEMKSKGLEKLVPKDAEIDLRDQLIKSNARNKVLEDAIESKAREELPRSDSTV